MTKPATYYIEDSDSGDWFATPDSMSPYIRLATAKDRLRMFNLQNPRIGYRLIKDTLFRGRRRKTVVNDD